MPIFHAEKNIFIVHNSLFRAEKIVRRSANTQIRKWSYYVAKWVARVNAFELLYMDQTFHAGQYLFHYLGTYISSSCVRLVLQSGLWLRLDSSYRGFESHNKGWKGICYIEINRLYVG
jgi:hypothetical protein